MRKKKNNTAFNKTPQIIEFCLGSVWLTAGAKPGRAVRSGGEQMKIKQSAKTTMAACDSEEMDCGGCKRARQKEI